MADATIIRDAFRRWGYLQADLDPFGRLEPLAHPDLTRAEAPEADRWRRIYCGPIGVEFMHLRRHEMAHWVASQMEQRFGRQYVGSVLAGRSPGAFVGCS